MKNPVRRRGYSCLLFLLALLCSGVTTARAEADVPGTAASSDSAAAPAASLRVFVARRIVTMDAAQPVATAVAVRGDRIVAVGDLESLRPWLDSHSWELDETWKDAVLLPGLIDPHLHPAMAAILLPMEFVTPHAWNLPGREVEAVRGQAAYRARLAELVGQASPEEPLFVWGYHGDFHGPLTRADLDRIAPQQPLIVWHRSFHEIIANSKALEFFDISQADVAGVAAADFPNGHFKETGLMAVAPKLMPWLASPQRIGRGLAQMRAAVHAGGVTTIADMAAGGFSGDLELAMVQAALGGEETPFRTFLILDGNSWSRKIGNEALLAKADALVGSTEGRVQFPKLIKLFSDGAFFSQLMELGPPGYIDGHEGEWLMTPEQLEASARVFWHAGWQIHVHANGDRGIGATLDILEKLQDEKPRADHRFTLEHFGYSAPSQPARAAALGAQVSANPWYLYALGDIYAKSGLGPDRAAVIARLGAVRRAGGRLALHSDFTMAPSEPLRLAWVAANRETASGAVFAPEEKLSLDDALRAITIDAAWVIGQERDLGSIVAGKKADFTVVDRDPFEVGAAGLADLRVLGTVFEGQAYPAAGGAR